MKTVRFFAVFLALALFVTAIVPLARHSSLQTLTIAAGAPAQAFVEAVKGLPLLAPMSLSAVPFYTLTLENTATSTYYGCSLVSQKPKDWTKMQTRQIFDASWTVKNSGTQIWGQHEVDFGYVSGTKMYSYDKRFDLNKAVGIGRQIKLVVDMVSPKTKGYYTTVWGLYKGNQVFCRLSLTINVNK